MNKLLILLLLAVPAPAFAHDSLWMLCQGTGVRTEKSTEGTPLTLRSGIAVSVFDHRWKAVHRRDVVKFLLGGRQFEGTVYDLPMVEGKKTPAAALTLNEGKDPIFQGTIAVHLPGTLQLKGKIRGGLDATAEYVPFEASLSCKDMSGFGSD